MGEIVNLRRVRKAKARDAEAAQAAENRRLSGLTRSERKAIETERKRVARSLDAARIEGD